MDGNGWEMPSTIYEFLPRTKFDLIPVGPAADLRFMIKNGDYYLTSEYVREGPIMAVQAGPIPETAVLRLQPAKRYADHFSFQLVSGEFVMKRIEIDSGPPFGSIYAQPAKGSMAETKWAASCFVFLPDTNPLGWF
jgi:hypothetical protein